MFFLDGVGDTACFISDSIRYCNNYLRRRDLARVLNKTNINTRNIDITSKLGKDTSEKILSRTHITSEALLAALEEYERLNEQKNGLKLSVAIAVFELGVSLHYAGVIKKFTGIELSDGPIGLMGVISSTLILFEGYVNAKRDVMKTL